VLNSTGDEPVDTAIVKHILPFPGCETMRVLEDREEHKWTKRKFKNSASDCWRSIKS